MDLEMIMSQNKVQAIIRIAKLVLAQWASLIKSLMAQWKLQGNLYALSQFSSQKEKSVLQRYVVFTYTFSHWIPFKDYFTYSWILWQPFLKTDILHFKVQVPVFYLFISIQKIMIGLIQCLFLKSLTFNTLLILWKLFLISPTYTLRTKLLRRAQWCTTPACGRLWREGGHEFTAAWAQRTWEQPGHAVICCYSQDSLVFISFLTEYIYKTVFPQTVSR